MITLKEHLMKNTMGVISIGLESAYYETDFEEISYDNLLKLKKLYDEEGEDAVLNYVYNALRRQDDPEGLFDYHEPMPYLSVREYGMDGLNSIRVYEDDELIEELHEEVENVKIAKRKGVDEFTRFCKRNGPRFIVGYRTYCEGAESIAEIDSPTFDIKKLELLPTHGFDEEKYNGGDISINPTGFVYDGEEYYGDECGECEPIEVFGVIVDGNGNVDTSFLEEEDFEGFLTKVTNS